MGPCYGKIVTPPHHLRGTIKLWYRLHLASLFFVWKVSNQMQFTQVYSEPRYTKLKIQCKKKISVQPT